MANIILKLDALDKKILYELDKDARLSLTSLAKRVRSSPAVVDYRLKRFQEEGIIKHFLTFLDAGKLGLSVWNIYLRLQNVSLSFENEFYNYLCSIKQSWWVASCSGRWDAILSICVKDVKEFYNIISILHNKYGSHIAEQNIVAHTEVEVISRGYFLNRPGEGKKWYEKIVSEKLDEIDKKILQEMSLNARLSSVEIARKIKSTPRIVIYRIKELKQRGIIHRYRLALDIKKLDLSFYKVIIGLKDFTTQKNSALKQYCINEGNVVHYEQKIGPWMLELELDANNYEEADKQLKKMKEQFPDFIQNFELLLITEEHKSDLNLTKYI
jgi:DNA-binding Lrp family transcriptional regulator